MLFTQMNMHVIILLASAICTKPSDVSHFESWTAETADRLLKHT